MRDIPSRSATFAFVAGLALAVAGCGGASEPAEEAGTNLGDSNMILDEPANDASAMESAAARLAWRNRRPPEYTQARRG